MEHLLIDGIICLFMHTDLHVQRNKDSLTHWDSGVAVDIVDFCEGEPNSPSEIGEMYLVPQAGDFCWDLTLKENILQGYICEKRHNTERIDIPMSLLLYLLPIFLYLYSSLMKQRKLKREKMLDFLFLICMCYVHRFLSKSEHRVSE